MHDCTTAFVATARVRCRAPFGRRGIHLAWYGRSAMQFRAMPKPLQQLSPRHHIAVNLRLAGASPEQITTQLGVERRTVYLWFSDPLVKAQLDAQAHNVAYLLAEKLSDSACAVRSFCASRGTRSWYRSTRLPSSVRASPLSVGAVGEVCAPETDPGGRWGQWGRPSVACVGLTWAVHHVDHGAHSSSTPIQHSSVESRGRLSRTGEACPPMGMCRAVGRAVTEGDERRCGSRIVRHGR
jgi:hypothetical protein